MKHYFVQIRYNGKYFHGTLSAETDSEALKLAERKISSMLTKLEWIPKNWNWFQVSLEDAISAYERGSLLKKHCQAKLDEARLKVEKIRLPQEGGAVEITDFDE